MLSKFPPAIILSVEFRWYRKPLEFYMEKVYNQSDLDTILDPNSISYFLAIKWFTCTF